MSRKPSDAPWLPRKSGFWCATLNGRRRYLSRDYHVARRLLQHHRLKSGATGRNQNRDWWAATFAELADEHLDDTLAGHELGSADPHGCSRETSMRLSPKCRLTCLSKRGARHIFRCGACGPA